MNKITDGTTDVFFFAIRGPIYGLQRTIVAEDRPGEDGTARRLTGLKPKPFQLGFEVHVDTYAAAKSLALLLSDLKGYVVDVVQESIGNANCLILHVETFEPIMHANIRRGVYPSDGSFEYTGDS